jgi:hypothetical protein
VGPVQRVVLPVEDEGFHRHLLRWVDLVEFEPVRRQVAGRGACLYVANDSGGFDLRVEVFRQKPVRHAQTISGLSQRPRRCERHAERADALRKPQAFVSIALRVDPVADGQMDADPDRFALAKPADHTRFRQDDIVERKLTDDFLGQKRVGTGKSSRLAAILFT